MTEVRIPDRFGEVVGWRAWKVVGPPKLPRLYSVSAHGYECLWPTHDYFRAVCKTPGCDTPGERCSCGLYAAKSREHLAGLGYGAYGEEARYPKVIGEVASSGKVIPGTQGWRAEKGRILSLLVPFDLWKLVDVLADAYHVPVTLDNTLSGESVWATKTKEVSNADRN